MAECLVTIRGLPHIPSIKEINVRTGPGTGFDLAFKAEVGMSGLKILDVQPDNEGKNLNGKVYQWFQLQFHGGATGWARDDLVDIEGSCGRWGYRDLAQKEFAFALARGAAAETAAVAAAAAPSDPAPAPTQETPSPAAVPAHIPATPLGPLSPQEVERIKRAAFAITARFEGSGYKAYNNYDAGIVSYGLIQFTLAAGSLGTVLQKYLQTSQSETAQKLREYWPRVETRDPGLRHDTRFRDLLREAADEQAMRDAQDEVATVRYWDAVVKGYIEPRGLRTPLTYALLFDMGVNFGTGHGFVRLAETELGVPPRSRPGENGITEEQLIARVAQLRKQSHDRQAARDNLPGLRVRGDFWVNLVDMNDWGLQGDTSGFVNVKGAMIRVR